MFHLVYKTTCITTNRWYVGVHSTDDIDDGYFGSGKKLTLSIVKHGVHNHIREILNVCDSRKDAFLLEAFLVDENVLKDPQCMNIVVGGQNFGHLLGESEDARVKFGKLISKGKLESGYRHSEETKKKISENRKGKQVITKEFREKLSQLARGRKLNLTEEQRTLRVQYAKQPRTGVSKKLYRCIDCDGLKFSKLCRALRCKSCAIKKWHIERKKSL